MKIKLFAILLTLCLLFTVVACTPKNKKDETTPSDQNPSVEDSTDPNPGDGSQSGNQSELGAGGADQNTQFNEMRPIPLQ